MGLNIHIAWHLRTAITLEFWFQRAYMWKPVRSQVRFRYFLIDLKPANKAYDTFLASLILDIFVF